MVRQFSVSEARTAIACPRIFYFDEDRFKNSRAQTKRVTQLWIGPATTVTGCGKLFHDTIERFNALAARAPQIREALEKASQQQEDRRRAQTIWEEIKQFINQHCLNPVALAQKSPPQQQAFIRAVDRYVREVAEVLGYAVAHGHAILDLVQEFFGDTRKKVDVTFRVGPHDEQVRVRGILDYIYFDYRQQRNQILDFKLTPSESPSKDLLQVSLYAIMHHQQHGTAPDVGVLYLHPERELAKKSWGEIQSQRSQVFDLLASMVAWADYNESIGQGLKPPGELALCPVCPWNKHGQCERRLGPKTEGDRIRRWSAAAGERKDAEPEIESHEPPESGPDFEYEYVDGDSPQTECAPSESAQAAPASGIELGKTIAGNKPVLIPVAALNTHISVLGAAGSGKSYLAKVVAEEAIRNGIPVLAIDPQGDLVQFLSAAQLPPETAAADRQAQADFCRRAEVRVWTPGTSHGIRSCLSPLRLPKEADLLGMENPQRRREEWDALLSVAAGNLVELAQAGGDAEVQRTFLLEILRALTAQSANRCELGLSDIVAALQAPESLGLDEAGEMISKRDREKLKQKLYSRLRGPTSSLFTGGTPLDLDQFVRPFNEGCTPLNVVYLNALSDDDQKQYFVAALAAEIYRWMITSPSTGSTRLLVYLDEAKDFLPAGSSKPAAKEPLLRLFAQGRKYGVSCLICTQSPRSVDYNVFSNASTKLIGRLEAAQDVQRVAEWFNDGSGQPAWLPGRNGAKNHTFVGRWPEIATDLEGAEFRCRRLYSLHEAAWSPDQVEAQWAKSPLAARFCAQPSSASAV